MNENLFLKIDPHFENGVKVKQSLVQIESSLTSMFQSILE